MLGQEEWGLLDVQEGRHARNLVAPPHLRAKAKSLPKWQRRGAGRIDKRTAFLKESGLKVSAPPSGIRRASGMLGQGINFQNPLIG